MMDEKLFQLNLSEIEIYFLIRTLDVRLQELRIELSRTDRASFQHELHRDLDRLEAIYNELLSLSAGIETSRSA